MCASFIKEEGTQTPFVSLYKVIDAYMLNATLRPILKRNNVIYALYNILSNWSNGRIPSRKFLPKRLQIASSCSSSQPIYHYDHDYCHDYCRRSSLARDDLGRERAHLSPSPRHVRVARGPRGRAHAPGQGHRARVLRVRSDREITRVYLRVSAGFRPNPLAYQDLDAYAAAWRYTLVKELRAYKATSNHCFSVVIQRRFDEARFLRLNGGVAAKMHPKARAHRAWRRNAERMARNWAPPRSL
jgi:hypothetical protein